MTEYAPYELKDIAATEEEKILRDKIKAEEFAKDISWVMSDKRGRRFVWWLLSLAGVFRISYTGNSETYFREGMRQVGITLLDELKTHCDELYIAMERERKYVNKRNSGDGNK